MKKLKFIPILFALLILGSCEKDDDVEPANMANFTVTIENVAPANAFIGSGVINTPAGEAEPGPATPGKMYEFAINAGRSHNLSFAVMLAATNDLFYAPGKDGIALYDDNGDPISGDVTDQVYLWDAGTEVNEEPAVGANTVTNQSAPDTGEEENGNVEKIENVTNGVEFDYPKVDEVIKVTVTHVDGTEFMVSIEDLPSASLQTSEGEKPAPLSPGAYVVHGGENPLFTEGMPDLGQGIEGIAEDGNPSALGEYIASTTGVTYPASPGGWVLHEQGTKPLFTDGEADYGDGVEAIAEDGNAAPLGSAISSLDGVITGAVINMPVGGNGPGPILPGSSYEFSFTAEEGNNLSFVTMLAATNDVFFAFDDTGIALFDANGNPVMGDVTNMVSLWDGGTEVNEQPAIGPNTVTNQLSGDTGIDESEPVQLLNNVNDGYSYPSVSSVLKVTITAN